MAERGPFDFVPVDVRPLAVLLAHVAAFLVVVLAVFGACVLIVWGLS